MHAFKATNLQRFTLATVYLGKEIAPMRNSEEYLIVSRLNDFTTKMWFNALQYYYLWVFLDSLSSQNRLEQKKRIHSLERNYNPGWLFIRRIISILGAEVSGIY